MQTGRLPKPAETVLIWDVSHSSQSIVLSRPDDFDVVARKWRSLEERADISFFQSWAWVGCAAEARYKRPVLLQAGPDDAPWALALLNRTGPLWAPERLSLGESGNAELDAVFTEYNGPLVARGQEGGLAACLQALLNAPIAPRRRVLGRSLRLSGVSDAVLRAARETGTIRTLQSRPAPYVDFATLGGGEEPFLASLSANTRYQLRRSMRRYEAVGEMRVQRADSLGEALTFLDDLARLHQITWRTRGGIGAFANATFLRFHHALVERALPRGEIDLLRITAGGQLLGYLYNFIFREGVLAYQSGFDYTAAGPHQKPGLTSHYLAIEMYRRQGRHSYSFLAGDDRYKTSHANATTMLHWLDVAPPWSWWQRAPGR